MGITLISAPNAGLAQEHGLSEFGAVYRCHGCKGPIFFHYSGASYRNGALLYTSFKQVKSAKPFIDTKNISGEEVKSALNEALDCYSVSAWNGFAAVCRRVVQAICTDKGVKGQSKVERQIQSFIEMYDIDEEGQEILKQIIVTGHDGAHPHLPEVNESRAKVLLEFMKEVVRQVYDLPARLGESKALRTEAIAAGKQ